MGEARPEDTRLIATANEALAAGIGAAVAGNRIGDIAHAIGTVCRDAGYGILEGYGGHGIGRSMHEDPSVPNEGRPGRGMVLRHGMVLAIEPMLLAGGLDEFRHDPDGWTLRTTDGSQGRARRAHGGDHERRPSRADRALRHPVRRPGPRTGYERPTNSWPGPPPALRPRARLSIGEIRESLNAM